MVTAEYHDGWSELAAAVVGQACKDYVRALVGRHQHPERPKHAQDIKECERFFKSSWYEMLCDVDGQLLIRKLRHMAAEAIRKTEVS